MLAADPVVQAGVGPQKPLVAVHGVVLVHGGLYLPVALEGLLQKGTVQAVELGPLLHQLQQGDDGQLQHLTVLQRLHIDRSRLSQYDGGVGRGAGLKGKAVCDIPAACVQEIAPQQALDQKAHFGGPLSLPIECVPLFQPSDLPQLCEPLNERFIGQTKQVTVELRQSHCHPPSC